MAGCHAQHRQTAFAKQKRQDVVFCVKTARFGVRGARPRRSAWQDAMRSTGKRSLLVLHFAACEAVLDEPGSAEARGAFGFFALPGKARPQRSMAKKPLRRDFCRPGGAFREG
jgi:hypothetical protein